MGLFDRVTPPKKQTKKTVKVTPVVSECKKVEAVVRSEWVPVQVPMKKKNKDGTPKTYTKKVYKCKSCGYRNAIQTKYCPGCGKRCKD